MPSGIRAYVWQMYHSLLPVLTGWCGRNAVEHLLEIRRTLEPITAACGLKKPYLRLRGALEESHYNDTVRPYWPEECSDDDDKAYFAR